MRQDIAMMAYTLEAKTEGKLHRDEIAYFLLQVCKAEKIRPDQLNARIEDGKIKAGNKSALYIEPIHFNYGTRGPQLFDLENDYEDAILARQEAVYAQYM